MSKSERKKLIKELLDKGYPDTDGDGYPDCLEICLEYVTFDSNGNIILPTYTQLASYAWDTGIDELQIMMKKKGKSIDNLRILPLRSNPVIDDSDCDGIPDNEDENSNSADPVNIDDSLLDDSKIFANGYSAVSGKTVAGNGKVSSRIREKKNPVIEYDRVIINKNKKVSQCKNKVISKYYLAPNCNSDYMITVDTGKNDDCKIEVSQETGIITKKYKPVSDTELDDGVKAKEQNGKGLSYRKAYILESGKKYLIKITVTSNDFESDKFEVSFEQNNWVYAPNGGYVSYNIDNVQLVTHTFLTDKYVFSILDQSKDKTGFNPDITKKSDSTEDEKFTAFMTKISPEQYKMSATAFLCMTNFKDEYSTILEGNNIIGAIASEAGVVLLLPGLDAIPVIGIVVTLIGGATVIFHWVQKPQKKN